MSEGNRSTYGGAERHETHDGTRRQQAHRHQQGILERLDLVLGQTRVDDEQEDRRQARGAWQQVLDGREVGDQLGRQVGLAQGRVVRREVVAHVAEGACPRLSNEIDVARGHDRAW